MSGGLAVHDLRVGYGAVEVLHGLSLAFPVGSVVAVLGPNGAGKTTLLRAIEGSLRPGSGTITWDGDDITRTTAQQRARRGLTSVPAEANVFDDLSVRDNLALFGAEASIEPALAVFPDLADKLDRRARTLSGGERQMLALSRVVLRPGRALLFDEASRGLSGVTVGRLLAVLGELITPQRTIVLVEQYVPAAVARADVVYVLERGRLAWAGEGAEVRGGRVPTSAR